MVDVEVRAVLAPVVQAIEGALGQAGLVETAPDGFEPLLLGASATCRAARPGQLTAR